MDFPGRLIAALLAVILVLLFPLQYIAKTVESNTDSYIEDCTEQFTDDIRNKGYLNTASYEAYIQTLDASGELYDLEIEDIHPVTGEEVAVYDNGDDVSLVSSDNDGKEVNTYKTNSNASSYSAVNLNVKWDNSLQLVMNGSIGKIDLSIPTINQKEEIQSFAAHTHTADCYVGHRHDSRCWETIPFASSSYYRGTNVDYEFSCTSFNYPGYMYGEKIEIRCPICRCLLGQIEIDNYTSGSSAGKCKINTIQKLTGYGYSYDLFTAYNSYWGNPETSPSYNESYNLFYLIKNSINSGESDEIIKNKLRQLHFITNAACYNCVDNCTGDATYTEIYSYSPVFACDTVQDENPICSSVMTSITPLYPNQTVKIGESINNVVLAAYLDGHTDYIKCSSNYNPYQAGQQTVTLYCNGYIGNAKTWGTISCTINVTVISKSLSYITATPSSQIINRWEAIKLSVTAYYSDGTSALLSNSQYTLSPYDINLVGGPQIITVTYSEGGVTKTTSVNLYVNNVSSITVSPNEVSVYKYAESIPVNITANYFYGDSRVLTGGFTVTGYSPGLVGKQVVTFHYTERGFFVTANAVVNVLPLYKVCPKCGYKYDMNADDTDPGCPNCNNTIAGIEVSPENAEIQQGEALPITVKAIYQNEVSKNVYGWTSDFNTNKVGLQLVTVRYGAFERKIYVTVKEKGILCPKCGTSYLPSQGSCPICREKVVGISVAPGALTVEQYGLIELEVIATYADGSKRPVTDWSIDCTTAKPGVYKALVTYHNYSAEIVLTVLSQYMVTCPYCNTPYDSGEHPEGCPTCFYTITGIEAFPTNGSNLVQLGGTPDISVVLVFKDTHREIAKDGYTIEGFLPGKLGTQTITVRFKEFSCNLVLEVVNAVKSIVCPNGHIYYPNEDGTDIGCPFCVVKAEHLIVYYYDITYLYEILEVMYAEGVYHFEGGNYITVRATKRNLSLVSKIQKMFFKLTLLGRKRRFTFGGEVIV